MRASARSKAEATKAANLRAKAAQVKAQVQSASADPLRVKVYAMVKAYEACMNTAYARQRQAKYSVPSPGEKGYTQWVKAVELADALGAEYEPFVTAQFFWFDRWFSKRPLPYQLSTAGAHGAAERWKLYQDAIAKGEAKAGGKVVSREREVPRASAEIRAQHAERTLRQLMKNYGATEEEILRVFAKGPQATTYFDREWLRGNATYMRLRDAGEI